MDVESDVTLFIGNESSCKKEFAKYYYLNRLLLTNDQVALLDSIPLASTNDGLAEMISEIRKAVDYLLIYGDRLEVMQSSRWFRENGNLCKRKTMINHGFDAIHNSDLDPVTATNFIKEKVREIEGGLIPESIQWLMMSLLDGKKGSWCS